MQQDKTKTLTINDVARLAGVSKRTVSRVINNSSSVNEATREKIQAIIDQYDYAPSKQARGLASSRSYLVGLLSNDPNANVIHSVQRGVISAFSAYGYEMVVHPIDHTDANLISNVVKFVNRSNLDGLIVLPPISMDGQLLDALRQEGIKFVTVAAREMDVTERCVVSSDRIAMQQIGDLFVKQAIKRPAIIKGPEDRLSTIERFEGYREALDQRGIPLMPENIAVGDFSYESGLLAARELLAQAHRPDAIFASNDQMAIATIYTAEDMGIKVPEELLVVGYDDEPMAGRMRPSLTTLQRPNFAMANAAGLKIIALIQGERSSAQTFFTPKLIERDSTHR